MFSRFSQKSVVGLLASLIALFTVMPAMADVVLIDGFDGDYPGGITDGWSAIHVVGPSSAVTYSQESGAMARSGKAQKLHLSGTAGQSFGTAVEHGLVRQFTGLTPNTKYAAEIWMRFTNGNGLNISSGTDLEFRMTWNNSGSLTAPGNQGTTFSSLDSGPGDFRWLGGAHYWHYFGQFTTDAEGSGSLALLWRWLNNAEAVSGYNIYVDDMMIRPIYVATRSQGTPVIDGVLSPGEWAGAPSYDIMFSGRANLHRYGHNGGSISNEIMTPDDCSARIFFQWDDTFLYVGAEVTDNAIRWDAAGLNTHNGTTWLDDAVEVLIDGDHSKSPNARNQTEYNRGGGQVVVTAGNSTRDNESGFTKGVNWNGVGTRSTTVSGNPGTWWAEFAIRWSKILETRGGVASLGTVIGLTIGIDDDDDPGIGSCDNCGNGQLFQMGGTGFTTHVSSGNPWEHEDQWGDLRLIEELTVIDLGGPLCENDIDGDSVCDEQELSNVLITGNPDGSNRILPDSDGDGLTDGEEDSNRNGAPNAGETRTRNADTDGDGYEDGLELLFLGSDPLDENDPATPIVDADGDGLPASIDPNDNNRDTDGDRYDDLYDALVFRDLAAANDASRVPNLGDVNGDNEAGNLDSLVIQALFLNSIDHTNAVFQQGGAGYDGFQYANPSRNGQAGNLDSLLIQAHFLGNLQTFPLRF